MTRYDIESFLDDLETFLKSNLNTQISSLNSEKADSITLDSISDDAYFLQSLNEQVTNFNPFIFYGIDSLQTEGIGPALKKAYSVNVIVVLSDAAEGTNIISKKLYRYSRILEDLFLNNWATLGNSVKLKVQTLVPISFKLSNSSELYRAVGITLDFTLV